MGDRQGRDRTHGIWGALLLPGTQAVPLLLPACWRNRADRQAGEPVSSWHEKLAFQGMRETTALSFSFSFLPIERREEGTWQHGFLGRQEWRGGRLSGHTPLISPHLSTSCPSHCFLPYPVSPACFPRKKACLHAHALPPPLIPLSLTYKTSPSGEESQKAISSDSVALWEETPLQRPSIHNISLQASFVA